jgi:gag-polypeptide of LTR copia-type
LVDTGASNLDPTPIDTTNRDAKALFFIQQAVHDTVFVKITAEKTAKEAWTILKTVFQRSSKVIVIKLQGLRHEFETLNLKQDESVQSFLTRVRTIVN